MKNFAIDLLINYVYNTDSKILNTEHYFYSSLWISIIDLIMDLIMLRNEICFMIIIPFEDKSIRMEYFSRYPNAWPEECRGGTLMDNEQETIDRVKQISPDRCRQASTRPMEIMQLYGSCRVVILRSSATDETMVPLFIS